MAQSSFTWNDGVLLLSLVYSIGDLVCEWDLFNNCCKPIHHWLLVSYACVIAFRVAHLVGAKAAATQAALDAAAVGHGTASGTNEDFLLALRHKGALPRFLMSFTWAVALPFFTFWTLLGTSWLWRVTKETPQCAPSDLHFWFAGFWLLLCYIWIFIYGALGVVAWVLECRVQRAEADLRQIEDEDLVSRWGHVSSLAGFQSLPGPIDGGLSPAEIQALPIETLPSQEAFEMEIGQDVRECPICICELEPGDAVRRLPGCDHAFHRSCIDLWLLRHAECPLCKRNIRKALCKVSVA